VIEVVSIFENRCVFVELFGSSSTVTFIATVDGTIIVLNSVFILCAIPGNNVLPPEIAMLL